MQTTRKYAAVFNNSDCRFEKLARHVQPLGNVGACLSMNVIEETVTPNGALRPAVCNANATREGP